MNRAGKWILWALAAAFLLGLLPTLIDAFSEFFILTEEGFSVTQSFIQSAEEVMAFLKGYMWHIIIIYSLFIAIIIFMEGQNPDRTILWLLVLIFVPVFGVVLYMLLGPDMHGMRRRHMLHAAKKNYSSFDISSFKEGEGSQLLIGRMLHACCGAELLLKNRIDILINGSETFPALEAAIAGAERFVHAEFFIFRSDDLGHRIGDALAEAARRGVKVRLLYDAVGSWGLKADFVNELEQAGVECRSFMPVSLPIFHRQMNFRNHRKILVIDGKVAFTGGLNIGKEYEGMGRLGFWRDTFVRIEGEAVSALDKIFAEDWCKMKEEDSALICSEAEGTGCISPAAGDSAGLPTLPVQVVASGAGSVWHSISNGYYGMISRAQRRVWITSPYLVPGPALMNAMTTAALSGVDVRVMIPAKRDHFLVFWGSRSNIAPLLHAGARVFLYRKGFIHTKSVVSDGYTVSVGTCNMDVRSLEINFENQLFIYDQDTARKFEAQFESDMTECQELTAEEWEHRSVFFKLLESFGRLYSAQI